MVSQSILGDSSLIAVSEAFRRVLLLAERVAESVRPVLIEGESGTGKYRLARYIHDFGPRREGPFQVWHAGEVNPHLALGDLFGVERGAFTGADRACEGLFDSARGGSLLLDDIDKAPAAVQAQLLRFFDQGTTRRVGSTSYKPVDARILLTTNRNLRSLVAQGLFLPDLAYRIQQTRIVIPPLRERREDIAPLAMQVLLGLSKEWGTASVKQLTPDAIVLLEREPWPGNAREVEEVIHALQLQEMNASLIGPDAVRRILVSRLATIPEGYTELQLLAKLPLRERRTRRVVELALRLSEGNGREAAKALGLPERSFRRYLSKHGLIRRSESRLNSVNRIATH